ncbi:MAG TPA: glycosyltransferase family 4 protein [Alphaproteobacteria bacterium]|nr:glycosyltransferase family 4 protein [Alphaproteobacteria bacterium]
MFTLLVEGWRFYPQSFSIVNQFQCLEILKREDVRLFHRDIPQPEDKRLMRGKRWKISTGFLDVDDAKALATIPTPDGATPDAVFRIFFPYEFSTAPQGRTFVFVVTGRGQVPSFMIPGRRKMAEVLAGQDITLVTPSEYSKRSLIASGAEGSRIAVVPHGVDTRFFHPAPAKERADLRRKFGWDGRFVFLNVGAQYWWKGGLPLAKAFAAVANKHPHVLLVMKGLDDVYASRASLAELSRHLTSAERSTLQTHARYLGGTLSFSRVADLYRAADALVAPYMGEGFYLPALEAIACGLPAICTKGGPTDDFLRDEFALPIESRLNPDVTESTRLIPDIRHLVALMEQAVADEGLTDRARRLGPAHVAENYTWAKVTDRLLDVLTGKEPVP